MSAIPPAPEVVPGRAARASGRTPVVILGAGPAGIAAALALGRDAVLLEARTNIGGLCGTLELGGAVFDVGGHSFHTPHPEVRDLVFRSLEMCEQKRIARCYSHGTLIPYPFQTHFRQLRDPSVVEECERGLRDAPGGRGAGHLEGSLRERFGPGIARHFLLPYNRKLWARDLRRLSADWIPERICGAAVAPAPEASARKPLGEETIVAYPARGGFGEILRALARQVSDLRPGTRAIRVEPSRRGLVTEDGATFAWDRLVSTLPLPELLKITQGVPESLRAAAGRLEHVSLTLVLVVVGRPVSTEIQRIYAAGRDIPAHKVVISHNSSDFLRRLPRHGIAGEISSAALGGRAPGRIEERFVESLRTLGLIRDRSEVVDTATLKVRYAYPVPTHDRASIVERIRQWLEPRGIHIAGRFAEWAYINSDEAIHRGLTLGRLLRREELSAR